MDQTIHLKNNLRLVIVDNPYQLLENNADVRRYYSEMLGLKLNGFKTSYGDGALPFDDSDYFATHKIIYFHQGDIWIPVLAYRSITLERCMEYKIEFPLITLAKKYKIPQHLKAIMKLVEYHADNPAKLAYDSSFTIHPEFRNYFLQDVMTTIHVLFHEETDSPHVLGGGMHKFKLEKKYYYWGYEDLELNEQKLGRFPLGHINGSEGSIFYLKNFSPEAKSVANANRSVWESRLEFSAKKKQAVAA